MADCRQWVLLADAEIDTLAWLQSVDRPQRALAVASPRRLVPGYRVRVPRREIEPLRLERLGDAELLLILAKGDRSVTLNLKAPLVINLSCRLGRQVVVENDYPVQYELGGAYEVLRKSA